MGTMLYSPGISVHIATARNGIVDVSDDITRGSLHLVESDLGSLSLNLSNHRRKYDGVFTPNDRVTVQMKRIAWVQVFTGYLNQVPYFSVYPREVNLTASCTLKRLLYHPWDPGSSAAYALLNNAASQTDIDGGVRDKLHLLLTEVAEWPTQNIHIGALPQRWYDKAQAISDALASRIQVSLSDLGLNAVTGSSTPTLGTASGRTTIPGGPKFTGVLPANSGKISWFGGPQGGAYGNMGLTGESGITPNDPWYCAMRFPYSGYVNGRVTSMGTPAEVAAAMAWWKNRKILVVNSANQKAVVVRAADWGPGGVASADARVIDVSKQCLSALGATTDTVVQILFAADNATLGPVTGSALTTGTLTGTPEQAPILSAPSPTASSTTPVAASVSFTPADNLKANVAAARSFIQKVWPGRPQIFGWRSAATNAAVGGVKNSDHLTGLALDMPHGGGDHPNADQAAYATAVAAWFISNPNVFGTREVIWQNRWITATSNGWQPYTGVDHLNHVHISFKDTGQTAPGPSGGAWTGSNMPGFPTYTMPDTGAATSGNLVNAWQWTGGPSVTSETLSGVRALMNDEPVLNTVRILTNASMRSFMSAPNGDFISWFPDYFGSYGTAGIMNIADIEVVGDGFTVQWSDDRLKTHVFASAARSGEFSAYSGIVNAVDQMTTSGIASVEFPEIMSALFNIDPSDPRATWMLDSKEIFKRFGARQQSEDIGTVGTPQAEFWYALSVFQRSWASQFSSSVNLTFMPEVFPGMLLRLPTYKFQAYVAGVDHDFDFETGGFTTSVTVMAPSVSDGSGLFGMARAGA